MDAADFLELHEEEAAFVELKLALADYLLEQANEALLDLKEDRVRGSAVLRVATG